MHRRDNGDKEAWARSSPFSTAWLSRRSNRCPPDMDMDFPDRFTIPLTVDLPCGRVVENRRKTGDSRHPQASTSFTSLLNH